MSIPECSFRTRARSLARFAESKSQPYDLLIIGGGITGTSVARDAALRGMRVALVETRDFASGTSSKSSKLIHGGVRYLENFEFHLVFEALAERAWMLRAAPHLVHPLPFCLPVYRGHKYPRWVLGLGLWFYDLLALLRTPGVHRYYSKKQVAAWLPQLNPERLLGAFRFFDASMWDDALAVETARAAVEAGADLANYVSATRLHRDTQTGRVTSATVRDEREGREMTLHARQTVFCLGAWTDVLGQKFFGNEWEKWLQPSRGTHLVFESKRFTTAAAVIMEHPTDGRISFVIPRSDLGAGITIVGTTDGPSPENPESVQTTDDEIDYLLNLLGVYFPSARLSRQDVIQTYVGVRPLAREERHAGTTLQKISREHRIGMSPGGVVTIAGGKYTTARKIAEQVVDFAIRHSPELKGFGRHRWWSNPTRAPLNRRALLPASGPAELMRRYGGESTTVAALGASQQADPEGFPFLEAQVRFAVRHGMAMTLDDALGHRIGLPLTRRDSGQPWRVRLEQVFAEEMSATPNSL